MIVGGGKIGFSLAKELEQELKIKIIDNNKDNVHNCQRFR